MSRQTLKNPTPHSQQPNHTHTLCHPVEFNEIIDHNEYMRWNTAQLLSQHSTRKSAVESGATRKEQNARRQALHPAQSLSRTVCYGR